MTEHETTMAGVMRPWAETFPWECLLRETGCSSPDHKHDPMANDPCAVCGAPLLPDEVCYAVLEVPRRDNDPIPWVCWRHVERSSPLMVTG